MTLFYGESTSQRTGLSSHHVSSTHKVPLFVDADDAKRRGFVAVADALRAGETVTLQSGSALVRYSGNSQKVIQELESEKALRHTEARFLSDEFSEAPPMSGLQWFVRHEKNDFELVVGNATTPSARVAVALFEPNDPPGLESHPDVMLIRASHQTVHFGPINEISGRSAAGIVARAAMRVFEWKQQRMLALFSSPSCPFNLQLVDLEYRDKYRAFFDSEAGQVLFPRRDKDIFYAASPLLAVFSVEPGVAEHVMSLVRQVLRRHGRDDLRVLIRGKRVLKPAHGAICSVRDALGECPESAVEFVDLRLHNFSAQDCNDLVKIAKAASQLEIVLLDRSTGVSRACVEQLVQIPHIRVVSIVEIAVADNFTSGGKIIVDRSWAAGLKADTAARLRYVESVVYEITQQYNIYLCSCD